MWTALREHWPEYLAEAWGLGTFMVSACVFATILEYPGWPVRDAIASPLARRALMGLAMGLTAIAIISSPWGRRSGAHLNPAVTLTFLRLGKIARSDAAFYLVFQLLGGLLGVVGASFVLGRALADPAVRYVATTPGSGGPLLALGVEIALSAGLMAMVLTTTNHRVLQKYTPVIVGCMLAVYIALAAPLSGMSINPARTLASAIPSGIYDHVWVYLVGTTAGMLLAGEVYLRAYGRERVYCAKLDHGKNARCIFHCRFQDLFSRRSDDGRAADGVKA